MSPSAVAAVERSGVGEGLGGVAMIFAGIEDGWGHDKSMRLGKYRDEYLQEM